jgi:hypothetical protein
MSKFSGLIAEIRLPMFLVNVVDPSSRFDQDDKLNQVIPLRLQLELIIEKMLALSHF